MKKQVSICSLFFILCMLMTHSINAQQQTLKNHPAGTPLVLLKYTQGGEWGYILGHNSFLRQQYAEKYYIPGRRARVVGVVTHHGGRVTNQNNIAEYGVYSVGSNRLPATQLGGKQVLYKDINLSGNAMTTMFNSPIAVADSFFVSFNLFDYAHGGYEGDTVGLYCGQDGCRTAADISANKGRNVVQRHNHSIVDWRDFYTQNLTPIATHFAIYPIIELCPLSDINKSGVVDVADFLLFVGKFQTTCSSCPEDLNKDNNVNIGDFLILAGDFNKQCP